MRQDLPLHAPFAPSAAERWMACPASHLYSTTVPKPPASPYADRGTLLHGLAACAVTKSLRAMDAKSRIENITLDKDERDAIVLYHGFTKALKKSASAWKVEEFVRYSDDLFGTVDFLSVNYGVLNIVDFKTGRGVLVEVEENPQLMTYAMIALECLDTVAPELTEAIHHIHLHIVQPLYDSAPSIRSVGYTRDVLAKWKVKVLAAMQAALQLGAEFVPGPHCRWCPVKPQCPALMGLANAIPSPSPLPNIDLTPAQISEWLQKAEVVETWISALRELAHEAVEAGVQIPGWKLVDKRAVRKWTDEAAVIATAKRLKIVAQEMKILSPAQLAKKNGMMPAQLIQFIDQTPSGKNLVRDPSTDGLLADASSAQQPSLAVMLKNAKYTI